MDIKIDALIESKTLREKVINRTDVLDKVKKLVLLPNDLHVTVEMAANYFEVGEEVMNMVIKRNRHELEEDGLKTVEGKGLVYIKNTCKINSKARHLTLITRRSMLRIGMLLRDSHVAKSIRDYLLNVEEVSKEKAPEVIDEALVKQKLKEIELKSMRAETAKKNAAIKEAKLMMEFTNSYKDKLSPESITAMLNAATTVLTGQPLLPQPRIDVTYTAEQIGNELGISSVMVGRIANKNELKTAEYGYTILGKSRHSSKQVPQWVYNEAGRVAVIEAVEKEAISK
jgi:hypothetical protein